MNTLLPIYYQIEQTIKNWILNKEFRPGEKIPSENELAEKFKVSRVTVRQAIAQLTREGLLVSKRGYGTLVSGNENLISNLTFESVGFMDAIFYRVQKSKTKSVVIRRVSPMNLVREKLQLKDSEEVIQIERIQFIGDMSLSHIVNYIPLELGSKIAKEDLYKRTVTQVLEEDAGIKFTEAFQTIAATFATPDVAEKLDIPYGLPMMFVERIMYTKKQRPVVLSNVYYRGDLFKYSIRFKKRFNTAEVKGKGSWVHRIG